MSLEDIFLQLTTEDGQADAANGAATEDDEADAGSADGAGE